MSYSLLIIAWSGSCSSRASCPRLHGCTPGLRYRIPVFSDPAPGKSYAATCEQMVSWATQPLAKIFWAGILLWRPGVSLLSGGLDIAGGFDWSLPEKGEVLQMGVGTLRHWFILNKNCACHGPICAVEAWCFDNAHRQSAWVKPSEIHNVSKEIGRNCLCVKVI